MTELERIQTLLKEYGLYAKKSFGQNFLINEGIIRRIISKMDIPSYECVIEIGPGLASLTLPMSQKAKKLIAVDADRDMVMVLKEIFKDSKNTTIVQSDFLRFDPDTCSDMDNRLLIGNLPYNITSELLEYMLSKGFKSAGMMVQKEVAEKLEYTPGKKENCPLGALIKMTGDYTLITNVDSSSFSPAPKVESAFIRIDQKKKVDFSLYFVLKALFKDPNKTISNCLKQSPNFQNAFSYLKENQDERLSYRARQMDIDSLYQLSCLILEKNR